MDRLCNNINGLKDTETVVIYAGLWPRTDIGVKILAAAVVADGMPVVGKKPQRESRLSI